MGTSEGGQHLRFSWQRGLHSQWHIYIGAYLKLLPDGPSRELIRDSRNRMPCNAVTQIENIIYVLVRVMINFPGLQGAAMGGAVIKHHGAARETFEDRFQSAF